MDNTANFAVGTNWGNQAGQYIENYNATINNYFGESAESKEYVRSLSSEYRRQKDINPDRTPGTCQWFLDDPRFKTWHDAVDAHLLHVFAGPGCGKSVLVKTLIDERFVSNNKTVATLYFFFKRGQGEQPNRAASAIAAMLHQLYILIPNEDLTRYARSSYEAHGDKLYKMFNELWDIFVTSCVVLNQPIVCVIDALDECNEEDLAPFISAISKLYSYPTSHPQAKLKMIITSRPYRHTDLYPHLRSDNCNFIRFDGDEKSHIIAKEINMVIQDKVPRRLSGVPESVQNAIMNRLTTMENRTYLWLSMTLDYVERNIAFHGTEQDIFDLLESLPPEVDQAYEGMLRRSPYPELTWKLLSIILAAMAPMTIRECKLALKISQRLPIGKNVNIHDIHTETEEQFIKSLTELCGLLLVIREGHIYFIHQSARDYLLTKDGYVSDSKYPLKHRIDLSEAHVLLAEVCITYISLRDDELPLLYGTTTLEELNKMRPFMRYAAQNWPKHYQAGGEQLRLEVLERLWVVLRSMADGRSTWTTFHKPWYGPDTSFGFPLLLLERFSLVPLNLAAGYGLTALVQELLEQGADPNQNDGRWGSPLHAACAEKVEPIACRLLQYGANIWQEDAFGTTALKRIAECGWTELIRIILNRHVLDYPSSPLDSEFLVQVASSGNVEALHLVLDHHSGIQPSKTQFVRCIREAYDPSCVSSLLNFQQILHVVGEEAYAAALLPIAKSGLKRSLEKFLAKYEAHLDKQSLLEAIEAAYKKEHWTCGELLTKYARSHFNFAAELAAIVDVKTEMRKAVLSDSSFMLQLLFDYGLIQGVVKSSFYASMLRSALIKKHPAVISALIRLRPPDIELPNALIWEASKIRTRYYRRWRSDVSWTPRFTWEFEDS